MSARLILVTLWTCFLLRGFFYCSFLPIWEGYDEWAHFAFVQPRMLGIFEGGSFQPSTFVGYAAASETLTLSGKRKRPKLDLGVFRTGVAYAPWLSVEKNGLNDA